MESDSAEVVSLVSSSGMVDHPYASVVLDIRGFAYC